MESIYVPRQHIIQCYYSWTVLEQMPEVAGLICNNMRMRKYATFADDCLKEAFLLSVIAGIFFLVSATIWTQIMCFPTERLTENLSKLEEFLTSHHSTMRSAFAHLALCQIKAKIASDMPSGAETVLSFPLPDPCSIRTSLIFSLNLLCGS